MHEQVKIRATGECQFMPSPFFCFQRPVSRLSCLMFPDIEWRGVNRGQATGKYIAGSRLFYFLFDSISALTGSRL